MTPLRQKMKGGPHSVSFSFSIHHKMWMFLFLAIWLLPLFLDLEKLQLPSSSRKKKWRPVLLRPTKKEILLKNKAALPGITKKICLSSVYRGARYVSLDLFYSKEYFKIGLWKEISTLNINAYDVPYFGHKMLFASPFETPAWKNVLPLLIHLCGVY